MSNIVVSQDLKTFRCLDCEWVYVAPIFTSQGIPVRMWVAIAREVEKMHSCKDDIDNENGL